MKPTVGGMPPSDSMNAAIAKAQPGRRCASPAKRSRSQAVPRVLVLAPLQRAQHAERAHRRHGVGQQVEEDALAARPRATASGVAPASERGRPSTPSRRRPRSA